MVEKVVFEVFVVINEGSIEGVFSTAEKAEAYLRRYFPKDWTDEQVKQGLEEISDECYYERWVIE